MGGILTHNVSGDRKHEFLFSIYICIPSHFFVKFILLSSFADYRNMAYSSKVSLKNLLSENYAYPMIKMVRVRGQSYGV
jgi:hypothetical protein